MRVEAAAKAGFERSAPCVMLPASTMCRNKLRSVKSKRMGGGYLLILRRQATQKAYCNGLFSGPSFVNYEVATWGSRSRGMFAHPHLRLPVRLSCNAPGRWFSEADDGRV